MVSQEQQARKDELRILLRDLSDELSDLHRYYYFLFSAYTVDDTTLDRNHKFYITQDEQLDKALFFLGFFINRFSPKDIRQLLDMIHKAYELFRNLEE